MEIRLEKGTHRNTQAHIVRINQHTLYFSYETCIAYEGPLGRFRLENSWGPTTGRHINEMGLKDLPIILDQEMELLLEKI